MHADEASGGSGERSTDARLSDRHAAGHRRICVVEEARLPGRRLCHEPCPVTNQVAVGALRRPANRQYASRWSVLRREIALRAAPVKIQGLACLLDVPTSCGRTCGSEGPVASFPVPLPGIYGRSRMRTLENFSQATFREYTFFQALRR